MQQAMVTLTSEESKRLIAKAIVALEPVQRAKKSGLIGFSLCTSCGYVIQEILGEQAVNPATYCCGFIYSGGSCSMPDRRREKLLLLEQGKPQRLNFPTEDLTRHLDRMNADDIIIKSGNIMDPAGDVGVLVASPDGGEIGAYLPRISARGVQLIVPMTLNKSVPFFLEEIIPHMGITKFRRDRVHGMSCGMMALPGRVVTEIDAFEALFNVKALPAAMDGTGSGVGTATLILLGEDFSIEMAWQAVNEIKGEPKLKNFFSSCKECEDARGGQGGSQCSTRLTRHPHKDNQ
jgi:hypothetical protein